MPVWTGITRVFGMCFKKLVTALLVFSFTYTMLSAGDSRDTMQVRAVDAAPDDSGKYLKDEDFMYANTRRFTIDGSRPMKETDVKVVPAMLYGAAYTGIFVVQHVMQQNTIWKKVGAFHFEEDAKYSMYLDKPGHFFGTYLPSYIFGETLLTLGFSDNASALIGGLMGLSYTGYVEVLDGFSKDFGFSPSDFMADCAGAGFYIAQHYVPYLQNFTPKFMYVKPSWINEKNRKPSDSFIDDYSSQTFWLSMNVHNMLPTDLKKYWPEWLELSLGYGVYSLCAPNLGGDTCYCNPNISYPENNDAWGNRKLLISVDYNLVKLLPDGPGFFNWLKQSLRNFKMPAPTLEIGRKTKFYFVYPVNFTIGG